MGILAYRSRMLSSTLAFCALLFVHAQCSVSADDRPVCSGHPTCLDQGWTQNQRWWWTTVSQGSRLLPLSWMLALESPAPAKRSDSREPLLSAGNLERWGYLPGDGSGRDPYGLPLGFAIDEQSGADADIMCDTFPESCKGGLMRRKWVGMNCSACHTNDIEFNGRQVRVEGAPTLADFQTFLEDVLRSLEDTSQDEGRFARFARIVLKARNSAVTRRQLRAQLSEQIAWQRKLANANRSAVRYGHGRLDAQGHILNKVAAIAMTPLEGRRVPAEAPASYPFVWNASQQDRLQWNGIAENSQRIKFQDLETDFGALIRNTSEVIGVFAHIETDKSKASVGYRSSIRIQELIDLERLLAKLKSPRWPEDLFGAIDREKAERGKALYDKAGCSGCHERLMADDLTSRIRSRMYPIDLLETDAALACNTYFHRSKAGNYKDQEIYIGPFNTQATSAGKGGENVIGAEDFTRNMLVNSILGAIVQQKPSLDIAITRSLIPDTSPTPWRPRAPIESLDDLDEAGRVKLTHCLNTQDKLLAYKARPLNGIWATAPYLHNGSVPTLYDLLLPSAITMDGEAASVSGAETRPESFGVGSRKFDPRKVGFVTDAALNPTTFRVRDEKTGQPIPGNLNSGHGYGTTLTEKERYDLLEYLKTL